jgi:hypothetical protein
MKYKKTTKLNGVLIDLKPEITGLSWSGGDSIIIILSLLSTEENLAKKENITLPITSDLGTRLQDLIEEFTQKLLEQGIIENDRGGVQTDIKDGVGGTVQRIGSAIETEVGSSLKQLTDGVRAGMAENARSITESTTEEINGVRSRLSAGVNQFERELTEAITSIKKGREGA